MRSLVVVVVLLAAACSAQDPPGCAPYKKIPDHTMCKYKPGTCTAGATILRLGGFTAKEIKETLDTHNMLRKQLVDGQVTGQPKALKMREMVWDTGLAEVAQRLAEQCKFDHDAMRDLPGSSPTTTLAVGQNLHMSYMSFVDRMENLAPNMTSATLAWWEEVYENGGYNPINIKPFKFVKAAGHYTLAAWADTFKVGCGYAYYCQPMEEACDKLVACNYFPGGNIEGVAMYEPITTTAAPAG